MKMVIKDFKDYQVLIFSSFNIFNIETLKIIIDEDF
jgi:hypothetical protein